MVFRAKFTCKAERITSASARCFAHPMVHAWIMQKRAFCGTFVRNLIPYRVPFKVLLKSSRYVQDMPIDYPSGKRNLIKSKLFITRL